MALAQPALRQFGLQKLRNLRFRGGSVIGSAIGIGVSIGFSLTQDWDIQFPWSGMLQPDKPIRTGVGVIENGSTQNGSTNQQHQALRAKRQYAYRTKYSRKLRHGKGCCCRRCC